MKDETIIILDSGTDETIGPEWACCPGVAFLPLF